MKDWYNKQKDILVKKEVAEWLYLQARRLDNPFAHNPNLILVPVIASFDTFGKIIPLYFRYEGLRLKIDHIKWFNDRTVDIVKFCCEITLQDHVQEVILYYHKKNGMWTLEKIRE